MAPADVAVTDFASKAQRQLRYHRLGVVRDRVPLAVFLLIVVLLQIPISFPSVVPLSWEVAVGQMFGTAVRSSPPPVLPTKLPAPEPIKPAAEDSWLAWAYWRQGSNSPDAAASVTAASSAGLALRLKDPVRIAPSPNVALIDELRNYNDFLAKVQSEMAPLALAPVVLAGVLSWALLLAALRSFGKAVIHAVFGTLTGLLVYYSAPYMREDSFVLVLQLAFLLALYFLWRSSLAAVTVLTKVATAMLDRPVLFAVAIGRGLGLASLVYWSFPSLSMILVNPVGVIARVAQAVLLANYWYVHTRGFVAGRLVASNVAAHVPASAAADSLHLQLRSAGTSFYDSAGTSAFGAILAPLGSIAVIFITIILVMYSYLAIFFPLGILTLLALYYTTADPKDSNAAGPVHMPTLLLIVLLVFGIFYIALWKLQFWLTKMATAAILATPIAGLTGLNFVDSFAVGCKIYNKIDLRLLPLNMISINLHIMAFISATTIAMLCVPELSLFAGLGALFRSEQWDVALVQQPVRLAAIFGFNWLMKDMLDSLVLVVEIAEVVSSTQFSFDDTGDNAPINIGHQFNLGGADSYAPFVPDKAPKAVDAPSSPTTTLKGETLVPSPLAFHVNTSSPPVSPVQSPSPPQSPNQSPRSMNKTKIKKRKTGSATSPRSTITMKKRSVGRAGPVQA